MEEKLCGKCGGSHDDADCGAIGAGTGAPADTTPNDEDLKAIGRGGGKPWSRLKKAGVALGALAVVAGSIFGIVAWLSRDKPGATEVVLNCTYAANAAVTCTGTLPEPLDERLEWLPASEQPPAPAPAKARLKVKTSDGRTLLASAIVTVTEGSEGSLGAVKFVVASK